MNDLFMVIAFVGLAAVFSARLMNPRTGRPVFWTATVVTCVSTFLMAYPPNWSSGLLMSMGIGCLIIIAAYLNTEFIVIRGKTYSLFAELTEDEDYGGGLTARKAWWLTALGIAMTILIGITYFFTRDWEWAPGASIVVIALAAIPIGHRDALMDKPIAAGQALQFGLIAVLTLGLFTVAYLGAYKTTKRRLQTRPAYSRHRGRTQ
ncbi:hypothetical protein A5765_08795 [Mycolicibacterium celeriflavum]|uniref:hypothetical protein n=1 Tax=Mycolicibacterium celeriflavum TaxID=1249101 RepID=UPI000801AD7D|nr:hypothetical protein [Mycolicibacterium celeriflavum]OBG15829.1 hypothetical protein A5765_08795 [Mycolicibacterium celeriflavum]